MGYERDLHVVGTFRDAAAEKSTCYKRLRLALASLCISVGVKTLALASCIVASSIVARVPAAVTPVLRGQASSGA